MRRAEKYPGWSIFGLTGIVAATVIVMARLVRATYRGRLLA